MSDDLINEVLAEINKGIVWNRTISFDFDALVKLRGVIHNLMFERDIAREKLNICIEALKEIVDDELEIVSADEMGHYAFIAHETLNKLIELKLLNQK